MTEKIALWLIGALACGSILKIWFDTTFLCLCFKLLRALGFKKGDSEYWDIDPIEYKHWLRFQAMSWAGRDKVPSWLVHLWGCPGCFSTHVAFWTSMTISLVQWDFWWLLVGTPTFIWAGLFLFQQISDTTLAEAWRKKQKEKKES